MGGYFSARSGLSGEVDGAIVLGGPVERAVVTGRTYAHGMRGIVGNAMGFDRAPDDADLAPVWPAFDLRPLLDRDDTEVHLIPDAGHCATPKLPEAVRIMLAWLDR